MMCPKPVGGLASRAFQQRLGWRICTPRLDGSIYGHPTLQSNQSLLDPVPRSVPCCSGMRSSLAIACLRLQPHCDDHSISRLVPVACSALPGLSPKAKAVVPSG